MWEAKYLVEAVHELTHAGETVLSAIDSIVTDSDDTKSFSTMEDALTQVDIGIEKLQNARRLIDQVLTIRRDVADAPQLGEAFKLGGHIKPPTPPPPSS